VVFFVVFGVCFFFFVGVWFWGCFLSLFGFFWVFFFLGGGGFWGGSGSFRPAGDYCPTPGGGAGERRVLLSNLRCHPLKLYYGSEPLD